MFALILAYGGASTLAPYQRARKGMFMLWGREGGMDMSEHVRLVAAGQNMNTRLLHKGAETK